MSFSKITCDDDSNNNIAVNDNDDVLTCSDTSLKVDQSNLVIKAMNLMRKKTGIKQHFKIHLDKRIPMQAGLGGGSGNAATAMFAFNALCGYPGSQFIQL